MPVAQMEDEEENPMYVVRIRGLPWSCTQEDIKGFFDHSPEVVEVKFTYNREGRMSGEAYIQFNTKMGFSAALSKDHEKIGHRYIEVFPSKKSEMDYVLKARGKANTGGEAPEETDSEPVIRLRGLPFGTTKPEIIEFLEGVPLKPEKICMPNDHSGRPTGEAFVQVENREQADLCLQKHMKNIQHRYIEVFRSSADEVRAVSRRVQGGGGGGGPVYGGSGSRPGPYDRGGQGITKTPWGLSRGGGGASQGWNGGGGGGWSGGGGGGGYGSYGGGYGNGWGNYGGGWNGFGGGGGGWGGYGDDWNNAGPWGGGGGGARGGGYGGRGARGGSEKSWGGGGRGGGGRGGGGGGGGGGRSWNGGGTGNNWTEDEEAGTPGPGASRHFVKVRGIPFTCTEAEISQFFSPLSVMNVEILKEFRSNRPSGEARVEFFTHEDAKAAMNKDREYMGSRYVELFLLSHAGGSKGNKFQASAGNMGYMDFAHDS